MNNEPVAYVDPKELQDDFTSTTVTRKKFFVDDVPLYTHPVKDLEDIDINITWNENSMRDFGKDELNFARAILRKAQIEVGCAECGVNGNHALYCVACAEKYLEDKNTKGQK